MASACEVATNGTAAATRQLVIGTAGHIDHGKSALVRALTGVDTDRLPEEKSRGMTIDLGFAHTRADDCDLYFVDVPGHERFIRNMVAGASGVDVALLVVAADDSIMPQTREHIEILQILGVRDIVVAISKADLADREWCEAVADEVTTYLTNNGLSPHAVIPTSISKNAGIDELRKTLTTIERENSNQSPAWFRMPIDRVFSVPGRGTIVTGTVLHGSVALGDELQLWPSGSAVRIRDLQTHHDAATAASGRMRLALNLPGVGVEDIARGHELATPGFLEPLQSFTVQLSRLRMIGKRRTRRIRARLHIGTSEVLAEVVLSETPGAEIINADQHAVLKTSAPIVLAYGQGFALRDESGQITLGGGKVIRAATAQPRQFARHAKRFDDLRSDNPKTRLEATIFLDGWCTASASQLAARTGIPSPAEVDRFLQSLVGKGRVLALIHGNDSMYLHTDRFTEQAENIVDLIRKAQAANPRQIGLARSELPNWMPKSCAASFRSAFADEMIQRGFLREQRNRIIPAGAVQKLPPADQKLYEQIVCEIAAGAMQPPTLSTLPCRTAANQRRCDELVKLAEDHGDLVHLTANLYLHRDAWEHAKETVAAALQKCGALTVSEIRDAINSSRKVVVPLVEKFDAIGMTRRIGDLRELMETAGNAPANDANPKNRKG